MRSHVLYVVVTLSSRFWLLDFIYFVLGVRLANTTWHEANETQKLLPRCHYWGFAWQRRTLYVGNTTRVRTLVQQLLMPAHANEAKPETTYSQVPRTFRRDTSRRPARVANRLVPKNALRSGVTPVEWPMELTTSRC